MTAVAKPQPVQTRWSEQFWIELARGRFVLQRCRDCREYAGYPKVFCPHCYSDAVEWVPATGRGTIYTHSTVMANPPSTFVEELPYVIAIVTLEEGPRFLSRIVDADPADVACDAPVELEIREEQGGPMPMFKLADARAG